MCLSVIKLGHLLISIQPDKTAKMALLSKVEAFAIEGFFRKQCEQGTLNFRRSALSTLKEEI